MSLNRVGGKSKTGWNAQILATEIQSVNLEGGASGNATHNLVGSTHVVSGLDAGPPAQVLKALTATTFGFGVIADADVPATIARDTEVTTAVSDHAAAEDPHPGYLTPTEHTAIGDSSPHHAAVTLDATTHADDVLGLTGQEITLDDQAANAVFAGPVSGAPAPPTMRALVDADIPANIARAPGYFGDGSDGDVTVAVDRVLETFETLYCDNLTINAGIVLTVNGNTPIYVKGTLTINGKILASGTDGGDGDPNAGAVGGAGGSQGGSPNAYYEALGGSRPGGDAQTNGTDGLDYTTNFFTCKNDAAQTGAAGGNGSGAGAGTGGVGGAGLLGPIYAPRNYADATMLSHPAPYVYAVLFAASAMPGGDGGGGGGETDGGGGCGGGGGHACNIAIIARHIVWGAAGAIEAMGGQGGDGGASDGDGGSGGGGCGGNGGLIVLCYETETGSRNCVVTAGAGGTGGTSVSGGTGENGSDGYDGVVVDLGA